MSFSLQLDRITTYRSAEEAMVVRGLHMNEVIDKVNEINIYNLSLEPLIEKVTVGNYEPSVSNDADIIRGIHLRELINEINRVIVNDSLPIEPLNPRLIRNNNFRTKADVVPVTKSVLKEVVRRVSTLAPSWSSYWKTLFLNEYLLDEESGNIIDSISSNDGTAAGSLSSEIAVVNKGRVFNGVDTSISLTATHTFLTTDNITISFWFKPASISSVTYQILDRTTNIGSVVACYMANTTMSFRVRGSNSAGLTTIDYPLAITVPNVWYHIICERNVSADTINLWVNGIPKQAATTDATTANIGPLTLKIGAVSNESSRFAGTLDELRIGKTLLSPTDKLNLYNYNRNGKGSRFNKGYLVITFDDSVETQYTNGFPLLQAQGVRATFFTQTNVIGMLGRKTWANLTEMHNAGMDLQCHTHSATSLTLLDEAGVIAELQAVNAAFIANSLPVPLHIGYPQGAVNDAIEGWIRSSGLRLSGRQTGPSVPIYPYTNEMRMMSYPVDVIDSAGITAVKAILDNCVYYKNALIIYAHGVDAGTANSVSSASLNEIIDYAQSIGVEIVTMSQLHTLMD